MKNLAPVCVATIAILVAACDDKPAPTATTPSASAIATTSAAPLASAAPSASAPSEHASASASAAPAGSGAAATGNTKEVTVSVPDPKTETQKTVKAQTGGTVTVYLPDWPGTSWYVDSVDRTLGKAKEESIPGFAGPSTPGHQFQWSTTNPLLKAGQSHKVQFVNKAGGKNGKAGPTFTLTIEIV